MFGMSLGEMIFLGVIALIVIGPKQLPELARQLGRFMNDLKRATEGFTTDLKQQARIDFDLHKPARRPLDDVSDQPTHIPEMPTAPISPLMAEHMGDHTAQVSEPEQLPLRKQNEDGT